MFKKLCRYKYTYCVDMLTHLYVRVLIFMETVGACVFLYLYFANSVQYVKCGGKKRVQVQGEGSLTNSCYYSCPPVHD